MAMKKVVEKKGPVLAPEHEYLAYYVTLKIPERIMGGIPKSPDVIEKWLDAKGRSDSRRTLTETGNAEEPTAEEIKQAKEDLEQRSWGRDAKMCYTLGASVARSGSLPD